MPGLPGMCPTPEKAIIFSSGERRPRIPASTEASRVRGRAYRQTASSGPRSDASDAVSAELPAPWRTSRHPGPLHWRRTGFLSPD